MNEEMGELDLYLKELFISSKFEEMKDILKDKEDGTVKELSDYNWNIIKKYYDMENFTLLFQHYKFVAYSCFLVEYAHQRGLIDKDVFGIMLSVYNDIYEARQRQRSQ
jgi:hypothetical protein